MTLLDMDKIKIDPLWALRIPEQLAKRRNVLPFAMIDDTVHVACLKANDSATLQAVQRHIKKPIKTELVEAQSLKRALSRIFAASSERVSVNGDAAVSLCDEILTAGILRQASDIHIDPGQSEVNIRFRVDGRLEHYRPVPMAVFGGLLSRFKVLSGMDIAEKRSPQDGRFRHDYGQPVQSVELRVATLPTKYGERMTLRLLALQTESLTLERLGLSEKDLEQFDGALRKAHGLILVTGPTGSGKSTTLYAGIRRLLQRELVNIITIEDPIEYDIDGVAQVEVDSADKVSFSKALRSILRHDPDIVMVGEIRDRETADVVNKAALTGHLVFSTLHTNSALSAITRLLDMGVDRYLIAATLRLAMAQRLTRRLCQHCRQEGTIQASEARLILRPELAGQRCFHSKGCQYCAGRGYVGRLGLFEIISFDEDLSREIVAGKGENELSESLKSRGILSLLDDALLKLDQGLTSFDDVLKAVSAW